MARRMAGPAACLAVLVAVAAGSAQARTGSPDVVVGVSMMKEVVSRDSQGRESVELKEVTVTGPGDTLVYRIACTNRGSAPAHNARIVDPIPAGTVLVPGSWDSAGAELTVSVDGGRTFQAYPVRRDVRGPDGTTTIQDVPAEEYTHLRWTTSRPLEPGATRTAVFKVKVR